MTISYHWLCDYLPDAASGLGERPSPGQLSKILTSIGLEVESLTKYEPVKGSLQGLLIGKVVSCEQHPQADKLKVTRVDIGLPESLQIVCGAPNVAAGQKVVVAPVGTILYPSEGSPVSIKTVKLRGVESQGMICSEDEIGLGNSHAGIIVLPDAVQIGIPASAYFETGTDHIIEIGLTPNHMDAMSHLGVARDICAYLSHRDKKEWRVRMPAVQGFSIDDNSLPISVSIENKIGCERYSGLSIRGITVKESPVWIQEKLKAIGLRPINNIVDITNFVLHEMGQPLHAFDADAIRGAMIIVKNLPAGTKFITLDEKERTLNGEDLMICDQEEPMCLAGVFGGLNSGVTKNTKNIFIESAWFNPTSIRKTSFRLGLRTDAAIHFEKGMDISNTVTALKRAAMLIKESAGGAIASAIVDVYPMPKPKIQILLRYSYLKKLSGKHYDPAAVKNILVDLGFDIVTEETDALTVAVPQHKPDILLPADIVEEIMRIDGYDHIDIPGSITISPAVEKDGYRAAWQEKIASWLVGLGFHEILTNSISNSAYFSDQELETAVKMVNNLSAELNIMRPSLLETGLESIVYNINRKNSNLLFFEFGKSYSSRAVGSYEEKNHLCLYATGNLREDSWKAKGSAADFYFLKGICTGILQLAGLPTPLLRQEGTRKLKTRVRASLADNNLLEAGTVHPDLLHSFDIRQPVFFADFDWDELLRQLNNVRLEFHELPKQLPVQRDLAMIVERSLAYEDVERTIRHIGLNKLQKIQLFDIFESEKLGTGKKSLAISLTFMDKEKTLTDTEIDTMMEKIMGTFETELNAEIRK